MKVPPTFVYLYISRIYGGRASYDFKQIIANTDALP
jgi:hypothetical protein